MKEYQVGISGAGFIGKQHIEALGRIPGVRVKAISDVQEQTGKRVQEQYGIPVFYKDYKEMLRDPEITVIHNCTPTFLHAPINREAILAGKHVYCEKPLTLNSREAQELTELAGKMQVHGAVNFNYRNNVMVHEMKERISSGKIGSPFMVYGEYLQDWLLYDTDYDWRMDPEKGGESRAVADIGSHCLDTMEYVLGKKVVSLYAKLMNLYPVRKKAAAPGETFVHQEAGNYTEVPVTSEDAAFIMLEFEGGIHGLLYLSQVFAGKKNGMSISVSGTEASLRWEQERADHLWIGHRQQGNEDLYAAPELLEPGARSFTALPGGHSVGWADAFKNGISDFYRCLREGVLSPAHAVLEDGLHIMKLVDAALISSRENRWVNIEL